MKKLIFLLILGLFVSSCDLMEDMSPREIEKQKTRLQIQRAKKRAEQQTQHYDYEAYRRELEEEERARQIRRERARQERELYEKEQEAKYKSLKEEWDKFIQSGNDSLKRKTTQEVKKLVDYWKQHWGADHVVDEVGLDWDWWWKNAKRINLEVFSLENFYKVFGKPWKTQFIENEYFLWFTCKDGIPVITVRVCDYDDGWVNILDLNIL